MPRAKRVCLVGGCPSVAEAGGRCRVHARELEARRPSRQERHYDAEHDRIRRRLLPRAWGKPCPLCGEKMLRSQKLHLHHSTPLARDPSARGDQIVHASCNVAESNRERGRTQ